MTVLSFASFPARAFLTHSRKSLFASFPRRRESRLRLIPAHAGIQCFCHSRGAGIQTPPHPSARWDPVFLTFARSGNPAYLQRGEVASSPATKSCHAPRNDGSSSSQSRKDEKSPNPFSHNVIASRAALTIGQSGPTKQSIPSFSLTASVTGQP